LYNIISMQAFKHNYKKIYKQYAESLWTKHNNLIGSTGNVLDYFITSLKFMRDYYLLNMSEDAPENDKMKAASITTAVAEYEKFNSCINNYYKPTGEILDALADQEKEKIQEAYDKEKAYHWTNFWQLVMLNIEDWRANA